MRSQSIHAGGLLSTSHHAAAAEHPHLRQLCKHLLSIAESFHWKIGRLLRLQAIRRIEQHAHSIQMKMMHNEQSSRRYRYSLAVTSQFYFCGIPLRLDTAQKCDLNCLYCFAMARGGRRTDERLLADPGAVKRKLLSVRSKRTNQQDVIGRLLKHRLPLHFGGLSDPFSDRRTAGVSKQLLEVLCEHGYPTVLSTKGTSYLEKPSIMSLLSDMPSLLLQVSFSCCDEGLSSSIEPGVPPPEDRLSALGALHRRGVNVSARLQPLLPPHIEDTARELVPRIASAGVSHAVVEFLKVPVETRVSMFSDFCSACSWDAVSYYAKHHAVLVGREWILPSALKWRMLQPLINALRKHGISYGSGDYGLHHLGDTACCCGVDHLDGFGNWLRTLPQLFRGGGARDVAFAELSEQWYPEGSIRMYLNSRCRQQGLGSMRQYARRKWNRPGTANAPDQLLYVHSTGRCDDNGDVVYQLSEPPTRRGG